MRGTFSVIISAICITKVNKDIVRPFNAMFWRRFVDDIYKRLKTNQKNDLYEALNKYHNNIKVTLEKSPSRFLDTKSLINSGIYGTQVYRKETKIPTHRSSLPTFLKGQREMQFQ